MALTSLATLSMALTAEAAVAMMVVLVEEAPSSTPEKFITVSLAPASQGSVVSIPG